MAPGNFLFDMAAGCGSTVCCWFVLDSFTISAYNSQHCALQAYVLVVATCVLFNNDPGPFVHLHRICPVCAVYRLSFADFFFVTPFWLCCCTDFVMCLTGPSVVDPTHILHFLGCCVPVGGLCAVHVAFVRQLNLGIVLLLYLWLVLRLFVWYLAAPALLFMAAPALSAAMIYSVLPLCAQLSCPTAPVYVETVYNQ